VPTWRIELSIRRTALTHFWGAIIQNPAANLGYQPWRRNTLFPLKLSFQLPARIDVPKQPHHQNRYRNRQAKSQYNTHQDYDRTIKAFHGATSTSMSRSVTHQGSQYDQQHHRQGNSQQDQQK
jgi:hypothetical protein